MDRKIWVCVFSDVIRSLIEYLLILDGIVLLYNCMLRISK